MEPCHSHTLRQASFVLSIFKAVRLLPGVLLSSVPASFSPLKKLKAYKNSLKVFTLFFLIEFLKATSTHCTMLIKISLSHQTSFGVSALDCVGLVLSLVGTELGSWLQPNHLTLGRAYWALLLPPLSL